MSTEPLIAVFIDFENLALGVPGGGKKDTGFRMDLVLKRLLEKGRIVFKRAYCDWSRYRSSAREFHKQGIEMIDIPQTRMSGKNSADIHMVVDAMDLCSSKAHIDMFALITGDSDFSPLVSKLKENDKRVIGCGVKQSTSDLLIANCDEFIYYDDLVREATDRPKRAPKASPKAKDAKKGEALEILLQVADSLARDYDVVWGSMIKQAIRRLHPGFNERYHGYAAFSDLLEDAAEQGLVELDFDEERGNFAVRLPGGGGGRGK
ncbi:MAG TPA: NYN domain-containing protein [Myxococcota bacterium]|nr:NYN domain-containing protein [Myxococcota bacterium]